MWFWIGLAFVLLFLYLIYSSRFQNVDVRNAPIASIGTIFVRALLSALVKKEGQLPKGNPFPKIHLEQRASCTIEHLKKYNIVCSLDSNSPNKTTNVSICFLEALSTNLMATIISLPQFPLSALGLIHINNLIHQYEEIKIGQTIDLECYVEDHRITDRGIEVDLITTGAIGNIIVWKCITTLLSRKKTKQERKQPTSDNKEVWEKQSNYKVAENIGRKYASVSGDYNPHHLWWFTAKPFGFNRPIAQGLWSLAGCIAELSKISQYPKYPITVEASFKRPLFLPSEVVFAYKYSEGGISFALYDKTGKIPHLFGSVTASQ